MEILRSRSFGELRLLRDDALRWAQWYRQLHRRRAVALELRFVRLIDAELASRGPEEVIMVDRNALTAVVPGEVAPAEEVPAARRPSDTAVLLAGIDQNKSLALLKCFDEAAAQLQPSMGDMMWCVAQLQARVLASAQMGNEQVWVAGRFHELLQAAFPAMVLAVEHAKRKAQGGPPSDG